MINFKISYADEDAIFTKLIFKPFKTNLYKLIYNDKFHKYDQSRGGTRYPLKYFLNKKIWISQSLVSID